MKRVVLIVGALLSLLFALYVISYSRSAVPIQALSLVKDGQMLYLPQNLWSCSEDGACVAQLNGDVLRIEVLFRPAGSPFGECQARYGDHSLECTVRQHYYYRYGQTMRPYLVLTDDAEAIPLTMWQAARFRLETMLARPVLGEESAWTLITGVVALATGGFAFWSIRQALARRLHLPTGGSYKNVLLVVTGLTTSVALAAIVWIAALAFLFATGVMLD